MQTVNFDIDSSVGQLHREERIALYQIVKDFKPVNCLEIGTWKGQGSTYIIAQALFENQNSGKLTTMEIDTKLCDEAISAYQSDKYNYLLQHVNFYNTKDIPLILNKIDFCFYDGGDDGIDALNYFKEMNVRMTVGSVFCCHDWKQGKGFYLKDYLPTLTGWKQLFVLDSAVGFATFKKINEG